MADIGLLDELGLGFQMRAPERRIADFALATGFAVSRVRAIFAPLYLQLRVK
jgi:hypothetical protein